MRAAVLTGLLPGRIIYSMPCEAKQGSTYISVSMEPPQYYGLQLQHIVLTPSTPNLQAKTLKGIKQMDRIPECIRLAFWFGVFQVSYPQRQTWMFTTRKARSSLCKM